MTPAQQKAEPKWIDVSCESVQAHRSGSVVKFSCLGLFCTYDRLPAHPLRLASILQEAVTVAEVLVRRGSDPVEAEENL